MPPAYHDALADSRNLPARSITPLGATSSAGQRAVAVWLFVMCGMILVMVVLGGTTRLTGSGLSIMEWAPLRGALPPMSDREWQRLYGLYRQIPQYQLMNEGFGLAGFKHIFWLEWTHRLWGRLLGIAFVLPLAWFWWRGLIDRRLGVRLALLLLLGGLQGAVGWFMVASGFFPDSIAVSAGRLVVHLVLALVLYGAILWTGLSLLPSPPRIIAPPRGVRMLAIATLVVVAATIVAGGFTAGLHAGLIYNTFPLMDGRLVPESYAALSPFVRNLTENVATVQFDHRLLATLTAMLALVTAAVGLARPMAGARAPLLALGVMVLVQYGLGVATLLHAVPVPLAAAHQASAVLLLTAALATVHALRDRGIRTGAS